MIRSRIKRGRLRCDRLCQIQTATIVARVSPAPVLRVKNSPPNTVGPIVFSRLKRLKGGDGEVARPVQGGDVFEKSKIGHVYLGHGHELGNQKPRQNDVEQWEAAGSGVSGRWRQIE